MADPRYNEFLNAYRAASTPAERTRIERNYAAWRTSQAPDETAWNAGVREFGTPSSLSVATALRPFTNPGWSVSRVLGGANETPNSRQAATTRQAQLASPALMAPAAAAGTGAPRTGIQLAMPTGAGAPAATTRQPTSAADFLTSVIPGVRVTGTDRTPERNAEVGGARNSYHIRGGMAVDFAPPRGMSIGQVRKMYEDAGWTVHEAIDETRQTNGTGPHFHIAASPPGGGSAPARGNSGPQLIAPSAAQMMSFIPDPESIPTISLPDAPQQARPDARPLMELADKDALLAPLAEAMKVKPRDTSQDSWDRVQALFQGAATAAASAGPDAQMGQLILAAGAGAIGGFRSERGEQRELNREEEEANRQVGIALAELGLGIDQGNIQVRNANRNIDWQSGQDVKDVDYSNAAAVFQNQVQEIMTNAGITSQNVGARNQTNMARGQVGAGAVSDAVQTQNQATTLGWQADREERLLGFRTAAAGGGVPGAGQLLLAQGIPAERQPGEDDQTTYARQAANSLAAGQAGGVQQAVAASLISSGGYAQILDPAFAKEISDMLRDETKIGAATLLVNDALAQTPTEELSAELAKLASSSPAIRLYLSTQAQGN